MDVTSHLWNVTGLPGPALLAGGGVVYARQEKSLELVSFDQTCFYETCVNHSLKNGVPGAETVCLRDLMCCPSLVRGSAFNPFGPTPGKLSVFLNALLLDLV